MRSLTWTGTALQVNNFCILDVKSSLTNKRVDLFLVCEDSGTQEKHYQIWTNNKDSGFKLARSGSLPSGTQSITFADLGVSLS